MSLRNHRRRNLFSIRELAKAADVSPQTIQHIEHGQHTPRPSTMRRICTALGVEPLQIAEFAAVLDRWDDSHAANS